MLGMAVTIESLDYYNGFTYRECHLPLAAQGLVYLNGDNGHGKSTPFEVMQHLLFGTTSRGVKKDGIVCAVPGTDGFLGELVLTNPDGRWMIRQARNHSKHKTTVKVLKQVDGKWSTKWEGGGCPKKLEDAQKLAGSLLGLQAHEFGGCMYLSQTSAHTLIEGTPADKMRYIAQLFGLDVCDRVVTKLKAELKDAVSLTVDVPILEAQLSERQADADSYDAPRPEDLACMQSALEAVPERKDRLRDLIYDNRDAIAAAGQRDELQTRRDALGAVGDAEALKARAGRLADKRDVLRDKLQQQAERTRLEAELASFNVQESAEALTKRLTETSDELRELEGTVSLQRRREQLETQRAHLDHNASTDIEAVRAWSDRARAEHAEVAAAVSAKSSELQELQDRLADCSAGECPTCRQPLDLDALKRLTERTATEVGELAERSRELAGAARDWAAKLKVGEQYVSLTADIDRLPPGDLETTARETIELTRQIRQLEASRHQAAARNAVEERLAMLPELTGEDVQARLDRTETLLVGVQEEIARARQAAELDRMLVRLTALDVEASRRTVELAEAALEELEEAVEVVRERQVRAKVAADDYADLCEALAETKGQLERLAGPRERVKVLEASVSAMQKLKRRKLHQVVEAIRDCLPRFTSTMFSHEPNTRFAVSSDDESLDLLCRRRVGGQPVDIPVKSLSGGEKQRLSVALVFTLHALLHARKRPDLLILDEVDRGLDDVGIASLMSLVRSVRQQYGTVIMTSHRSQIAGAAFDRTWTVTKQDEVSHLRTNGGNEC